MRIKSIRKKQQKIYRKPFMKLKTIKSTNTQKVKTSEKSDLTNK